MKEIILKKKSLLSWSLKNIIYFFYFWSHGIHSWLVQYLDTRDDYRYGQANYKNVKYTRHII